MDKFSGLQVSGEASKLLAMIDDLGGRKTPVPVKLLADYLSVSEENLLGTLQQMKERNIIELDETQEKVSLSR